MIIFGLREVDFLSTRLPHNPQVIRSYINLADHTYSTAHIQKYPWMRFSKFSSILRLDFLISSVNNWQIEVLIQSNYFESKDAHEIRHFLYVGGYHCWRLLNGRSWESLWNSIQFYWYRKPSTVQPLQKHPWSRSSLRAIPQLSDKWWGRPVPNDEG